MILNTSSRSSVLNCGPWPGNLSREFARNVGSQAHTGPSETAFYNQVPRILRLPEGVKAFGTQPTVSSKGEGSVYVPQPQEIPSSFFPSDILKGGKSNHLKYSELAHVRHNSPLIFLWNLTLSKRPSCVLLYLNLIKNSPGS